MMIKETMKGYLVAIENMQDKKLNLGLGDEESDNVKLLAQICHYLVDTVEDLRQENAKLKDDIEKIRNELIDIWETTDEVRIREKQNSTGFRDELEKLHDDVDRLTKNDKIIWDKQSWLDNKLEKVYQEFNDLLFIKESVNVIDEEILNINDSIKNILDFQNHQQQHLKDTNDRISTAIKCLDNRIDYARELTLNKTDRIDDKIKTLDNDIDDLWNRK